MVKRETRKVQPIRFFDREWEDIKEVAKAIGYSSAAEFIRSEMRQVIKQEREQMKDKE